MRRSIAFDEANPECDIHVEDIAEAACDDPRLRPSWLNQCPRWWVRMAVRYRLLETIRKYDAEQLDAADETTILRRRHQDFFADTDYRIEEFLHVRWLRWAETEADNLRTALEWSLERNDNDAILRLVAPQAFYWCLTGRADVLEWAERPAARPGPGLLALRIQARFGLAHLLLGLERVSQTSTVSASMIGE